MIKSLIKGYNNWIVVWESPYFSNGCVCVIPKFYVMPSKASPILSIVQTPTSIISMLTWTASSIRAATPKEKTSKSRATSKNSAITSMSISIRLWTSYDLKNFYILLLTVSRLEPKWINRDRDVSGLLCKARKSKWKKRNCWTITKRMTLVNKKCQKSRRMSIRKVLTLMSSHPEQLFWVELLMPFEAMSGIDLQAIVYGKIWLLSFQMRIVLVRVSIK